MDLRGSALHADPHADPTTHPHALGGIKIKDDHGFDAAMLHLCFAGHQEPAQSAGCTRSSEKKEASPQALPYEDDGAALQATQRRVTFATANNQSRHRRLGRWRSR